MHYENTLPATFLARPNRFVAEVEVAGRTEACHVKNTSRLWELLLPGVPAVVQRAAANPARKTRYDLIAVAHGGGWVNIDSQAPNKVFGEWLRASDELGTAVIRPEAPYGSSRFDFYIETEGRRIFAEVKGVTLVEAGIARFPGAPTLRGVKHLEALCRCMAEGYEAMVAFIVQRADVHRFAPNDAMQPAFGRALRAAAQRGVRVLAIGCDVTQDTLTAARPVEVLL